MLSSKLKSWVESHLGRPKKLKLKNSKKTANSVPSVLTSSTTSTVASSHREDRLSMGAASTSRDEDGARGLALPCGVGVSGRRSNAALVIQLQNDMVMNASGWSSHSQLANSPLIAWRQHQQRDHLRPSLTQVNQSPSSTNSTQFPTNESTVSTSSKATSSSICTDLQSCSDMTTLTTTSGTICQLSSPESAYSTGCSADISPTSHDDVTLDTPPLDEPTGSRRGWSHEVDEPANHRLVDEDSTNQRRAWSLDVEESTSHRQGRLKDMAESNQDPSGGLWQNFSPRARPAIRTNPWIQRNSSPQATDRVTASGAPSEHRLTHPFLSVVKETDIVSDGEPVAAPLSPDLADFRRLVGGQATEASTDGHSMHLTGRITQASNQPTPTRQAGGERRWDADDQYSKLIRETEAILSQLENDELLLTAFKIGESAAETLRTLRIDGSSVQGGKTGQSAAPPVVVGGGGARLKKTRRKSNTSHQRRSSRALELDWTTSSSSDESSDDFIAPRRLQPRNRRSRVPQQQARASRDHEQDADWLVGRQFWTPMESRRCLPLVDYSDDRPPSPAPADPVDYHRRDRSESDQSRLNKQKYIDDLLAEIWPEDFDCLLSCNSGDVKLKKTRQQLLQQQHRKTTSSCPGSPAVYWRQEQQALDNLLADGAHARGRGVSDADAAYRSFDYGDRHGNRRRKPKKRSSVRKTPSAPSSGGHFNPNADAAGSTPSTGGKSKEELWNETLLEQQRLECEVAYLRQQLMNSSSSASAFATASGATVDPPASFQCRN